MGLCRRCALRTVDERDGGCDVRFDTGSSTFGLFSFALGLFSSALAIFHFVEFFLLFGCEDGAELFGGLVVELFDGFLVVAERIEAGVVLLEDGFDLFFLFIRAFEPSDHGAEDVRVVFQSGTGGGLLHFVVVLDHFGEAFALFGGQGFPALFEKLFSELDEFLVELFGQRLNRLVLVFVGFESRFDLGGDPAGEHGHVFARIEHLARAAGSVGRFLSAERGIDQRDDCENGEAGNTVH